MSFAVLWGTGVVFISEDVRRVVQEVLPVPESVLKRSQGRPRNQARGQDGRSRLIEATRDLIKKDPALAAQRGEVARAAGVTPALVTYYFPDHPALLELAMRPVVDRYMHDLLAILQGANDADTKLRSIILLLIRVHIEEPHLIDAYVDLVRVKPDAASMNELLSAYAALIEFLRSADLPVAATGADPDFIVFALWGTCRTVAQQPKLPGTAVPARKDASEEARLVELVLRLFYGLQNDAPGKLRLSEAH